MSYKFDSLILILNKLDRRERVTIRSLMDELQVAERTVHRYLVTITVAGFPIDYDRSRQTYVFREGYTLRSPELTLEETLAFALAKRFLSNFGPGMETSLSKVERTLAIKKADIPKHIVLSAEELPVRVGPYLASIHKAIINFQKIELTYHTLFSDKVTTRKVDPYYLFFEAGFWNLRAYCHLRQGLRTFALDRIVELKVLDQHFVPERIAQEEELSGGFGAFLDGEPVEVVLMFDAEVKPRILRKKWHRSQTVRELDDGRVEMQFSIHDVDGLKWWIYQWIPYVEVIAPDELRETMSQELHATLTKNKKKHHAVS